MTLDDLDRRIHCPKFLSIPNYLRKGQSYGLQIWPVRYIDRVHPNKRRLKPVEKRGVGVYRDCPNFLGTPYYLGNMKSYELQILYALLYDRLQQTPIKNFRKSSHGCNHGLPKIFRASIYRAHRAVIFAIARLSCYKIVTYTAVVLSFLQSSIRKLADVWSEHRNLNEAIMSNMLVVYR